MMLSRPTFAMNPELSFADVVAVPTRSALTFAIRYSPTVPGHQELVLEDASGYLARWIISRSVKHLAKRPVMLWRLATHPNSGPLMCLESGAVQSAATQSGAADLRSALAEGLLRLTFNGHLLRGYYRLQCLPTGCGQVWQLSPINRG